MLDKIFSQHPTIHRFDKIWLGITIGLIVPLFGIVLVYLLSVVNHFANGDELIPISMLIHHIRSVMLFTKFLSVGCILNLGAFFLFINRNYINAGRGVIIATIIVALPIIFMTLKNAFTS